MMRATAAEAATPPRKAFSLVEIETAVRETELVHTDFFLEIFPEMSFQAWGIKFKRLFVTVTKSVKKKPSASLTTSHLLFEFSY